MDESRFLMKRAFKASGLKLSGEFDFLWRKVSPEFYKGICPPSKKL